jgi:hypothetical protein
MSMTYVLQESIQLSNNSTIPAISINDTTLANIIGMANANDPLDYIMQNNFDTNGTSLYDDAQQISMQSGFLPSSYLMNVIGTNSLNSGGYTTVPVSNIEYYWVQVAKQLASNPNNPVGSAQNWLPVGIVVAILVIVLLLAK